VSADRVCTRLEGKARTIELIFRSGLSPFFTIPTRRSPLRVGFPGRRYFASLTATWTGSGSVERLASRFHEPICASPRVNSP